MNPIDQLMTEATETGVFPGAALSFAHKETVLHSAHYGHAALEPAPVPIEVGAVFDVA